MPDERAGPDRLTTYAPMPRPPKVKVAAALLVISGALIPVIAGIALVIMASAYGGTGSGPDASVAALVLPSLLKAAFGIYVAIGVLRGDASARWAGIGFLLLIVASSVGGLAGGEINPVSFMTIVALIGIAPLLDPGVRAWCRFGERPVLVGIAKLTAVIGIELAITGISTAVEGGGPLSVIQTIVGIALVCVAFPVYKEVPGFWMFGCALVLVQPLFALGVDGASARAEVLGAVGRLALGLYVVIGLVYATFKEPAAKESLTTSG